MGHSFGGDIALAFAALYPDRVKRVAVIEPVVPSVLPSLARTMRAQRMWMAGMLEKAGIPVPKSRRNDVVYMLHEALKYPARWGPMKDMSASWRTEMLVDRIETTTFLEDVMDISGLTRDMVSKIQTPVHLIYDKDSRLWARSYRAVKKLLPNATSALLETGTDQFSHFLPLEMPDVVVKEIFAGITPVESLVG